MKISAKNLAAIISIITVGTALSVGFNKAQAAGDNVTDEQIVRALTVKKPLTRGLSVGPPEANPVSTAAEPNLLKNFRGRSTRSLSVSERDEIATLVKDKPNIDLEITFDYNSANISARSLASVQALGRALTSNELRGSTFVVAGHTDAAGTDAYNQDLSERRADAIRRYLVDKYKISANDLVTVGYGKSKLKDAGRPLSAANRRVQVVNMENKATASSEQ
jgi:outer membrane protein OmpA-like peptidoglycan-associated protein